MGKRGPMGKGVPELKLHGTFRKDRHAARASAPDLGGVPVRPERLPREAAAMWAQVVPRLVAAGVVGAADTRLIVATCRAWALAAKVLDILDVAPTDPDARAAYAAYMRAFHAGLTKLGLSPLDRSRLAAPAAKPGDQPDRGVSGFARKRGGA